MIPVPYTHTDPATPRVVVAEVPAQEHPARADVGAPMIEMTRLVRSLPGRRVLGLVGLGVSVALHVGLLSAAAASHPQLGATAESAPSAERYYVVYPVSAAAAERELDENRLRDFVGGVETSEGGSSITRADGDEAGVGIEEERAASGQLTLMGPMDNPDPHIGRVSWKESSCSCSVGLDPEEWGGNPLGYTGAWDGLGSDPVTLSGDMKTRLPASVHGFHGTAAKGIGDGSREIACVPGRGVNAGPVHRGGRPPVPNFGAPKAAAGSGAKAPSARRATSAWPSNPQYVVCGGSQSG